MCNESFHAILSIHLLVQDHNQIYLMYRIISSLDTKSTSNKKSNNQCMRCTGIFYKQYFSFAGTIATISQISCIILFHKTIKRSNEIWKEQMVCCILFFYETATDPECNLLAIHMYMIYTCFITYPVSCFLKKR